LRVEANEYTISRSTLERSVGLGKFASPSGVEAVFYDANGREISRRKFAHGNFQGGARPAGSSVGSDDWLRDIYLADSEEDLASLIRDFPSAESGVFHTSGSSPDVSVVLNEAGVVRKFSGQFVVATNSNPAELNETNQIHITTSDPESLSDRAPLKALWKREVPNLE
jgi:hypothetical protein